MSGFSRAEPLHQPLHQEQRRLGDRPRPRQVEIGQLLLGVDQGHSLGPDLRLQAQQFEERLGLPALAGAEPVTFGVGQFVEVDDRGLDEHPAHIGARPSEPRVRRPPDQVGAVPRLGERSGHDDTGELPVDRDQRLPVGLLGDDAHVAVGLDQDAPLDQLPQRRDQRPLPGRPSGLLQLDVRVCRRGPDVGDELRQQYLLRRGDQHRQGQSQTRVGVRGEGRAGGPYEPVPRPGSEPGLEQPGVGAVDQEAVPEHLLEPAAQPIGVPADQRKEVGVRAVRSDQRVCEQQPCRGAAFGGQSHVVGGGKCQGALISRCRRGTRRATAWEAPRSRSAPLLPPRRPSSGPPAPGRPAADPRRPSAEACALPPYGAP